jgi:hypothetical protein
MIIALINNPPRSPFEKGGLIIPLFEKEGLGEIFRNKKERLIWLMK